MDPVRDPPIASIHSPALHPQLSIRTPVCFNGEVLASLALSLSLSSVGPVPPPATVVHPSPYRSTSVEQPAERKFDQVARLRTGGAFVAAAGMAGLATTATMQALELRSTALCVQPGPVDKGAMRTCFDNGSPANYALRSGGLTAFLGGSFGAGYLFGRARALRDIGRGNTHFGDRQAMALFTTVTIGTSATLLVMGNVALFAQEMRCEDPRCMQNTRASRYILTDLSSVGLAAGLGMAGHTLGRLVELRRFHEVSLAPSVSPNSTALAVSGRF